MKNLIQLAHVIFPLIIGLTKGLSPTSVYLEKRNHDFKCRVNSLFFSCFYNSVNDTFSIVPIYPAYESNVTTLGEICKMIGRDAFLITCRLNIHDQNQVIMEYTEKFSSVEKRRRANLSQSIFEAIEKMAKDVTEREL